MVELVLRRRPFTAKSLGSNPNVTAIWAPRLAVRIGDCLSPGTGSIPVGLARIALDFFGITGCKPTCESAVMMHSSSGRTSPSHGDDTGANPVCISSDRGCITCGLQPFAVSVGTAFNLDQ